MAKVIVDAERCLGCGYCADLCEPGCLALVDDHADVVDIDICTECGLCERGCPEDAIRVM